MERGERVQPGGIPRVMERMLEALARVATIVGGMKEFSRVDRTTEKAPADLNRALESTLIVARNERGALAQGAAPPEIDMELLQQAGVADRLPE